MMLHQHLLGPSTSISGNTNSVLQSNALSDGVLISHSHQPREELKTTFETREGVYRVMTLAEYSRPRGPQQDSPSTPDDYWSDKLCFNIGRELYVYHYRGTHVAADLARPIDKRVYKGTAPTVHCFNQELAHPKTCSLIVGFSTGQIQIIDPLEKSSQTPVSRLYNEDRTCDKSTVTCIRWLPGSPNIFLASYASGNIYVYNEDVATIVTPPSYNIYKQGERFTIYTCKSKTPRNPVYRWQIGDGAIHQFSFSGSDAKMMATVGHDGFLRIFNYHQMELVAIMKSYFGGLLTLAWSPDAKLIATGGEDDLLTVFSVQERRVICRGQGHKSWISQVQFDSYCCTTEEDLEPNEACDTTPSKTERSERHVPPHPSTSGDLNTTPVMRATPLSAASTLSRCSFASFGTINGATVSTGICYRIGSVGHDTLLCLWDITEDMLKPANIQRHRNSTIIAPMAGLEIQTSPLAGRLDILTEASPGGAGTSTSAEPFPAQNPVQLKAEKPPKKKRFHRRGFTIGRLNVGGGSSNSSNSTNGVKNTIGLTNGTSHASEKKSNHILTTQISCCDETRLLGSRICPRIQDVPVIEPLMCKKIAHERLTVLEFREDSIVTACQEGYICTWARPGKAPNNQQNLPKRDCINSPSAASPELPPKNSDSHISSWAYGSDQINMNNVQPTRSTSSYSNSEFFFYL
ncbi:unnamed protein product [Caenorhabditis bovis]|uniref:WD_REPEATS_REGION domain-containing protein n=1 Tax=Caenorhabditis bovis TaxID=2654633 RepID=A0A8S1ECJ3_9PELO|nr:unnamed protein product [Caenorhabditis bovis]